MTAIQAVNGQRQKDTEGLASKLYYQMKKINNIFFKGDQQLKVSTVWDDETIHADSAGKIDRNCLEHEQHIYFLNFFIFQNWLYFSYYLSSVVLISSAYA